VRSVRNKAAAIHDVITDHQLDFLRCLKRGSALMTHWLSPTMLHRMVNDARCRSSSDSKQNVGGGLAVIYRDDLTVRKHPLLDKMPVVMSFELQLVCIGSTSPFHAVVHSPLSTDVGIFVDELANVLATIVSGCSDHLLLCRDANCMSAIGPSLDERLSTTFMEFGLTQHVTLPTRGD